MGKWSFLKQKQVLILSLFAIVIATTYTNCSTYQDSNLFQAPSNGDLGTAAAYENRIYKPNQGANVEALENMINIGGECNVLNGVVHYIELRLLAADGPKTPYRVREDGVCVGNSTDPECFRINVSCLYGRYNANIPVSSGVISAKIGCKYFVHGQLVTIENGVEKREVRNAFDLDTNIYDNINPSCPW